MFRKVIQSTVEINYLAPEEFVVSCLVKLTDRLRTITFSKISKEPTTPNCFATANIVTQG